MAAELTCDPARPAEHAGHKTGTGARGYMDAGIVFKDHRPLFVVTAYTEHVPVELPDGTPGFTAAYEVIGRLARMCWDAFGAGRA